MYTIDQGSITGSTPPLDVSYYEGSLIALSMTCSEEPSTTEVRNLLHGDPVAGTSGAAFTTPQVDLVEPRVSGLTINCVSSIGPAAVGGVVVSDDLRPLEQSRADEIATGRLTVFLALFLAGAALVVGTIGWFARNRLRL